MLGAPGAALCRFCRGGAPSNRTVCVVPFTSRFTVSPYSTLMAFVAGVTWMVRPVSAKDGADTTAAATRSAARMVRFMIGFSLIGLSWDLALRRRRQPVQAVFVADVDEPVRSGLRNGGRRLRGGGLGRRQPVEVVLVADVHGRGRARGEGGQRQGGGGQRDDDLLAVHLNSFSFGVGGLSY